MAAFGSFLRLNSKARRERQVRNQFKTLIATPAGPATIPASANFAIKSTAGNAANATAVTIAGYASEPELNGSHERTGVLTITNSRTVKVKALGVGGMTRIGRIQAKAVVTCATGFELWVEAGLGKFYKVGVH